MKKLRMSLKTRFRIPPRVKSALSILLLPWDVWLLTIAFLRILLRPLRRAFLRLIGRKVPTACPYGPKFGYYGYSGRPACTGGKYCVNRWVFRCFCQHWNAAELGHRRPGCTGKGRRIHPAMIRVALVGIVLAMFWSGAGVVSLKVARYGITRLRARHAHNAKLDAERAAFQERRNMQVENVLTKPLREAADSETQVDARDFLASASKLVDEGDYARALLQYRNAIQNSPSNAVAHYGKGLCLFRRGDPLTARVAFEAASELPETPLETYIELARVYMVLGKLPEAAASAEKLKGTHLDDAEIRMLLASCYEFTGAVSNALDEVNVAVAMSPTNSRAFMMAGRLHLSLHDADGAERSFTEAHMLDTNAVTPLIGLSKVARSRGDWTNALSHIEMALAKDADNPEVQVEFAELQVSTGAVDKAVEVYETVVAKHKRAHEVRLRLAELLLKVGRRDDSLSVSSAVLKERMSTSPEAHLIAARAYADGGLFSRALEHCEDALRLELREEDRDGLLSTRSKVSDVHQLLAACYAARGENEAALSHVEEGLAIVPGSLPLLLMRGRILDRLGRGEEARVIYAALKGQHADTPLPDIYLGQSWLAEKDRTKAAACYEDALSVDPDNLVAGNNLAAMLLEDGTDVERTYELAQRLYKKHPRSVNVADTYGWACVKKGQYDEAISALSFAARWQPRNPNVRYHLGVALIKKGEVGQGTLELEVALAISDKFEGAEQARELLAGAGGGSRVAGYWLLVTGYWLLVIGY